MAIATEVPVAVQVETIDGWFQDIETMMERVCRDLNISPQDQYIRGGMFVLRELHTKLAAAIE